MDSKFFFFSFVTVPVAPIITGIITHFMFRTWCISAHKFLYYYYYYYYVRAFKKRSVSTMLFCKNGEVIGMKVRKAELTW
jgi:hypothetical protein